METKEESFGGRIDASLKEKAKKKAEKKGISLTEWIIGAMKKELGLK